MIDAGEEDGRPYIVFEYVEGETLKDRIRRMGRLPVDEAIAYAIEIARALGAAHARHIVHRDVKPQNVLIDEEGSAKVTDFGIARSLDEEGLTADGRVLGTTDYVSPEQALGHDVNGQSDIYSLGVVLYEMLTGDVPFHGENQVAVAMKHVREDLPDVQTRRPDVSAGLAAILDRMTDKHLEHRYPDARTLEVDLEDALAVEAARTGPRHRRGDRRHRHAARERAPPRCRSASAAASRSSPSSASLLLAGAVAAVLLLQGVERTQRGTGAGHGQAAGGHARSSRSSAPAPRTSTRSATTTSTPTRRRLAVDKDPGTSWTTESYSGGTLAGKAGVGLYVDAAPGVSRHLDRDRHARARLAGGDPRRARRRRPDARPARARVAEGRRRHRRRKRQRFTLRTDGKRYRYYLVWITKLPPGPSASRSPRSAVPEAADLARTRAPRARRGSARARAPAAGRRPTGTTARSPPTSSGSRSSAVMPGSVLSSLTSTRPPSSTKKSTRASPEQPTRRNVSRASACTSSIDRGIHPRRDLAAPRRPARTWPRSRTNRPPAARPRRQRRLRLPVARHRALDLDPGRERLDDRQPVVLERGLQRPVELLRRTAPSRSPPTSPAAPA